MDLKPYLAARRELVENALQRFVPDEDVPPAQLHRAMRHSLFAGGKRLRPILALAACEACGGEASAALHQASAIECIHTFSLIHDDLPCMDDDELRRGVPTCHVVFGEAVALLAGDALQALAFELLAGCGQDSAAAQVSLLANASGSGKLIGGQVLDLEGEQQQVSVTELEAIHRNKTAALLSASLELGGMAIGATDEQRQALRAFGEHLGLAFQVIDDILDVTADSATLGKTAGKDAAVGKSTYPALIGLEASRAEAHRLTDRALTDLQPFGTDGEPLRAIARHLLEREY